MNEDEMGGACSKYGGRETYAGFWWGVDEQGCVEGLDCLYLADMVGGRQVD